MLSYICRLVSNFEKKHGIRPNTLFVSWEHSEHLQSAFDEQFSLEQIMEMLAMDVVIDDDVIHPRVIWTQLAYRAAS